MKKITWRHLNTVIRDLTEDELLDLLNKEQAGERRKTVLKRLHQRQSKVRTKREREAITRKQERDEN